MSASSAPITASGEADSATVDSAVAEGVSKVKVDISCTNHNEKCQNMSIEFDVCSTSTENGLRREALWRHSGGTGPACSRGQARDTAIHASVFKNKPLSV